GGQRERGVWGGAEGGWGCREVGLLAKVDGRHGRQPGVAAHDSSPLVGRWQPKADGGGIQAGAALRGRAPSTAVPALPLPTCGEDWRPLAHFLEQPGEVAAAAADQARDDDLLGPDGTAMGIGPERILDRHLRIAAGAELPVGAVGQDEADALAIARAADLD